jgi:hypothetical protein
LTSGKELTKSRPLENNPVSLFQEYALKPKSVNYFQYDTEILLLQLIFRKSLSHQTIVLPPTFRFSKVAAFAYVSSNMIICSMNFAGEWVPNATILEAFISSIGT